MHAEGVSRTEDGGHRYRLDPESVGEKPRQGLIVRSYLAGVGLIANHVEVHDRLTTRLDVPQRQVSGLVQEREQQAVEAVAAGAKPDQWSTLPEEGDRPVELARWQCAAVPHLRGCPRPTG